MCKASLMNITCNNRISFFRLSVITIATSETLFHLMNPEITYFLRILRHKCHGLLYSLTLEYILDVVQKNIRDKFEVKP